MLSYNYILNVFLILSFITYSSSSCPPGKFPFMKSCLKCKKGTYSPEGTECIKCPPGTYTSEEESIECRFCKPGTYSSNYGSTKCLYCEPGTYNQDYASIRCYTCPDDSTSDLGATSCYRLNFWERTKKIKDDYNAYNYDYRYDYM